MSSRVASRPAITAALVGIVLLWPPAALAGPGPGTVPPFPQFALSPATGAVVRGFDRNANPLNTPIAGARVNGQIVGRQAPPSLAALQAARPGHVPGKTISPLRLHALRQAALSYGARGGLAAESYTINLELSNYRQTLDKTFDFTRMVQPIGNDQTLLVPPIVTEAQFAFALAPGGQIAKQTDKVYEITQQARLASAPPNWRSFLVRSWSAPTPPPRNLMPHNAEEARDWARWVAQGWALGEQQGVQIFLDDLDRLQTDYIGMLRYAVLLRAGLVEPPDTRSSSRYVSGGRNRMLVGNKVVRITDQPGLNPNNRDWHPGYLPSGGPIGAAP
ncbi:MAG: type IV secretory system conjugative DNA transfer family protein [Acidiphilium sp.]|nr:type IV secretory system conjugative DNA transfer family protein [Acidiphilium sp.]